MKSIAIMSVLLLVGCHQKMVQVPSEATLVATTAVPEKQLTDTQKIALLRTEAHKRNLEWYVHCIDWSDNKSAQFLAVAIPQGGVFGTSIIEDGSKGRWIETAATQADAAYALYQSIQQPMTHPPEHRKLEKHKHCPPELRGN